jgi:hypothetical protein
MISGYEWCRDGEGRMGVEGVGMILEVGSRDGDYRTCKGSRVSAWFQAHQPPTTPTPLPSTAPTQQYSRTHPGWRWFRSASS